MKRTFLAGLLGTILGATAALSAQLQEAQAQEAQAQDSLTSAANENQTFYNEPPPRAPGFETSAALLFLQPSAGNMEYGTLISPLPAASPHWQNQAIEADFSPAFRVGVRFIVNASGNDLQVNWTHLNVDKGGSFAAGAGQFVGPSYQIGPEAGLYKFANGSAHYAYDSINFDAGQMFYSRGPIQVRAFGGLQLGRLSHRLSGRFVSDDGLLSSANTSDSVFTGAGPRLGMKTQWEAGNFDFLGEIAGSALLGTMQSHLDFTTTSPELIVNGLSPNNQSLTSPSVARVVPSIDTRLGGGYTFPVRLGFLRIEAGYQAAVYFNCVNEYSLTEVLDPPEDQDAGVFLRTATTTQGNFAVHGPYVGGSWAF